MTTSYQTNWNQFKAAFTAYKAAMESITDAPYISTSDADNYMKSLTAQVIHQAEKDFAAPGARLDLGSSKNFSQDIEKFSPDAIYSELQAAHGGQAGITKSLQTVAQDLRCFGELRGEAKDAKLIGGRFVLSYAIYGDWSYNYSAKDSIARALAALRAVAIQAGIWCDDMVEGYEALKTALTVHHSDAREIGKVECFKLAHVATFKTKIEFRIAPALAEALQVFMAEYSVRY